MSQSVTLPLFVFVTPSKAVLVILMSSTESTKGKSTKGKVADVCIITVQVSLIFLHLVGDFHECIVMIICFHVMDFEVEKETLKESVFFFFFYSSFCSHFTLLVRSFLSPVQFWLCFSSLYVSLLFSTFSFVPLKNWATYLFDLKTGSEDHSSVCV